MKKRQLLTAAVLCTAFLAGGTTALAADNATIHTGVYVDGIDMSGMTRTEALDALNTYVDEMGAETLTLRDRRGSRHAWQDWQYHQALQGSQGSGA